MFDRITKGTNPDHIFDFVSPVRVAILDVDLLMASAIEFPIEKRDNICVRKHKDLYGLEKYVIEVDKVENNLFQVIGIKEQKVREVYSLIPPQKVEYLFLMAIALRNTLN